MKITMNPTDVVNASMAECYITVDGKRYLMMMARDFSAHFKKNTAEVPILGRRMVGHKATGAVGKFAMTIYKVTELFDEMCRAYKDRGEDILFDIQVTTQDPASQVGTSSKIFRDCMLSGEVLLAGLSAEDKWLEQKVEGFFDDFETYETFQNPKGM